MLDPTRQEILSLFSGSAPLQQGALIEKMQRASAILRSDPRLYRDPEVCRYLLSCTVQFDKSLVQDFRTALIVSRAGLESPIAIIPSDELVHEAHLESQLQSLSRETARFFEATKQLVIGEEGLARLDESSFWSFIEKEKVKTIAIQMVSGKTILYDNGFIPKLLAKKPRLSDLVEEITVEFPDGTHTDTRGRLLLCGDYFETLFSSNWSETVRRTVVISAPQDHEVSLTFSALREILQTLEDGKTNFEQRSPTYFEALSYLQLTIPHSSELPEGFFGQKEWEKCFGTVGEVPAPPLALWADFAGPCPFSPPESEIKMGTTHLYLWIPPTIDERPLTVGLLEYKATLNKRMRAKPGIPGYIQTGKMINQPLEKGYWLAIAKQPLFVNETRKSQKQLLTAYDFPTTREAVAACLMVKGILSGDSPVLYTRCESVVNEDIIVGNVRDTAYSVISGIGDSSPSCGVLPVRRYFCN